MPSDPTNQEAVERVAKLIAGHYTNGYEWRLIPKARKEQYRKLARRCLAAAYPQRDEGENPPPPTEEQRAWSRPYPPDPPQPVGRAVCTCLETKTAKDCPLHDFYTGSEARGLPPQPVGEDRIAATLAWARAFLDDAPFVPKSKLTAAERRADVAEKKHDWLEDLLRHADARADSLEAALRTIDGLMKRWGAPLRHKIGDKGEAAWAAVGSEAHKIAHDALNHPKAPSG